MLFNYITVVWSIEIWTKYCFNVATKSYIIRFNGIGNLKKNHRISSISSDYYRSSCLAFQFYRTSFRDFKWLVSIFEKWKMAIKQRQRVKSLENNIQTKRMLATALLCVWCCVTEKFWTVENWTILLCIGHLIPLFIVYS